MRLLLAIILTMGGFINPLIAQSQSGIASVRPLAHEGTYTQAGVIFSHDSIVASHRSIPFGSIVKVTNLNNQKSVDVMINDRGPFINGRIIDLSEYAGQQIGMNLRSLANVRLDILKIADHYNFKNSYNSIESGTFSIQVGSFGDQVNAKNFASELKNKHDNIKDVFVNSESYQNKALYKVYIGKFPNRTLAENYLSQLPDTLQSGYVTSVK